jgi:hypothetical protein
LFEMPRCEKERSRLAPRLTVILLPMAWSRLARSDWRRAPVLLMTPASSRCSPEKK